MTIKTKFVEDNPAFQAAYDDLIAAVRKHSDKLTPEELLALFAKMTGRTMAMLDQSKYTTDMAFTIITENIEHGNMEMIAQLLGTPAKGNG